MGILARAKYQNTEYVRYSKMFKDLRTIHIRAHNDILPELGAPAGPAPIVDVDAIGRGGDTTTSTKQSEATLAVVKRKAEKYVLCSEDRDALNLFLVNNKKGKPQKES
jgi:hypothetical protein